MMPKYFVIARLVMLMRAASCLPRCCRGGREPYQAWPRRSGRASACPRRSARPSSSSSRRLSRPATSSWRWSRSGIGLRFVELGQGQQVRGSFALSGHARLFSSPDPSVAAALKRRCARPCLKVWATDSQLLSHVQMLGSEANYKVSAVLARLPCTLWENIDDGTGMHAGAGRHTRDAGRAGQRRPVAAGARPGARILRRRRVRAHAGGVHGPGRGVPGWRAAWCTRARRCAACASRRASAWAAMPRCVLIWRCVGRLGCSSGVLCGDCRELHSRQDPAASFEACHVTLRVALQPETICRLIGNPSEDA